MGRKRIIGIKFIDDLANEPFVESFIIVNLRKMMIFNFIRCGYAATGVLDAAP